MFDSCVFWVGTLPSKSGKWRFGLGPLTKNIVILVATVTTGENLRFVENTLMPCHPPGLKEKNVFSMYFHFPLFLGAGLLRKVYTKMWIFMRGCYMFGRPGIHYEGIQDSWPPCFLHTGTSSNWACGTDGGADGDAGAHLWFGNVVLVCSWYPVLLVVKVFCCWMLLDVIVVAGAGGGDTDKEQEEDPKETINIQK